MTEHSGAELTKWQRFKKQLKHKYQLKIMNEETFEEVANYRLSLSNVYLLFSSIAVVTAVLVVLAIAFTPLKQYIPGYGDMTQDRDMRSFARQMRDMEKELETQREYTENFRRILVGDYRTPAEAQDDEPTASVDPVDVEPVPLSEEEVALRREIELQRIGDQARNGEITSGGSSNVPLEQFYFSAPIKGEISAKFNPQEKHYGVDILAPKNTAIKAVMDGYIIFSDWTLDTGNTIGIQHTNNITTFYKHNSELLKETGSFVKAGEAVAIIGNTGTQSSGPHLHFELWYQGKPVNPVDYLKF